MQAPPASPMPGLIECAQPINAGPMHWVFNAAVHWINRWARYGTPPPIAPRLETSTPSHAGFVSRFSRASRDAVESGFLLLPDSNALRRAALLSDIGR